MGALVFLCFDTGPHYDALDDCNCHKLRFIYFCIPGNGIKILDSHALLNKIYFKCVVKIALFPTGCNTDDIS